MPRELADGEGIRWSCVEAYAGLAEGGEGGEGAQAERAGSPVEVVCTPSGGAKTVRLQLEGGWGGGLSDEELLRGIKAGRAEGARQAQGSNPGEGG